MAEPAGGSRDFELLGIPAAARKSFVQPDAPIEVYPENQAPLDVWLAMRTQWRPGFSGAVGLVYEALPVVYRACGVARRDQPDVFAALRVMERETLAVWREQAERDKGRR